jgi:hypothetical protein
MARPVCSCNVFGASQPEFGETAASRINSDHGAINCNASQCEVTANAHLCERDVAAASLLVPPVSSPQRDASGDAAAPSRPCVLRSARSPSIDAHGSHVPCHHRLGDATARRRGRHAHNQVFRPHAAPHGRRSRNIEIDQGEALATHVRPVTARTNGAPKGGTLERPGGVIRKRIRTAPHEPSTVQGSCTASYCWLGISAAPARGGSDGSGAGLNVIYSCQVPTLELYLWPLLGGMLRWLI